MHEALYYIKKGEQKIRCYLCPHECLIVKDRRGICGVRKNIGGTLVSEVYGYPVAIHYDPVEKKPLYHFHPGKQVLSIGTVGCNMKCFFCQNCDISQETMDSYGKLREIPVSEIISMAEIKSKNIGVAYTYNEPTIYYEYMKDIAIEIRCRKMKNLIVTNGYISEKPLRDLLRYADAFNVDLKSFNDEFYRSYTKSRLDPVLNTIRIIAEAGIHLEITHLLIPGLNDDVGEFDRMVNWIADIAGPDTPFHLSRYFPRYKATEPVTPLPVMKKFRKIAGERLNYVYLGNIDDSESSTTYCKNCQEPVIERHGYHTSTEGLGDDGKCVYCGTEIIRHM